MERRFFDLPPKVPELEEVKIFEDALREIAPEKLEEAVDQMELIIWQRKRLLNAVRTCKRRGEINLDDELFWVSVINHDFAEFYIIQRWLRYWLEIQSYIAPETLPAQGLKDESLLLSEKFQEAKKHPIEDLYDGYLRMNGSRLMGRCPFHEEGTPSFVIYTDTNDFHCFGCQAHGDAIDFYMMKKEVSFIDAVNIL